MLGDHIFNSNPLSNAEKCIAGFSKNTDMIGLFMNSITHDDVISKTHDDINSNIHDDITTNPIKTIYSDVTDIYRTTAFVNRDQSLPSHSKTTVSDSYLPFNIIKIINNFFFLIIKIQKINIFILSTLFF